MARYFSPDIKVDYQPLGSPPAGSPPFIADIDATLLKHWYSFSPQQVAQPRFYDLARFILDATPFEGFTFVNGDYVVFSPGGWRWKYRIQAWYPWSLRLDKSLESILFICYLWEPPLWLGAQLDIPDGGDTLSSALRSPAPCEVCDNGNLGSLGCPDYREGPAERAVLLQRPPLHPNGPGARVQLDDDAVPNRLPHGVAIRSLAACEPTLRGR